MEWYAAWEAVRTKGIPRSSTTSIAAVLQLITKLSTAYFTQKSSNGLMLQLANAPSRETIPLRIGTLQRIAQ